MMPRLRNLVDDSTFITRVESGTSALLAGRLFCVFTVTAKPSGGNISKWPFHCQNLRSLKKDTSAQSPRPFPVMGKGAALEDIYTPAAPLEIAQPGQTVKGRPPQAAVRCTLDGPLPAVQEDRRRRGIYHHRALCRRGGAPRDNLSRSVAGLFVFFHLFRGLCQLGRLFLLPLVQQSHDLLLHFGGSGLLAKVFLQFGHRNNHAAILLFLFA